VNPVTSIVTVKILDTLRNDVGGAIGSQYGGKQ